MRRMENDHLRGRLMLEQGSVMPNPLASPQFRGVGKMTELNESGADS